jgi:hypothetical protein
MAVIAAHGSVHPEGRYFQLVSDEGVLKVSADDLADALRNVDVVVLFVCSCGRTDKYPAANTTIGRLPSGHCFAKAARCAGPFALAASLSRAMGKWPLPA